MRVVLHLMRCRSLSSIVVRRWSEIIWHVLRLHIIHRCTNSSSTMHWRLSSRATEVLIVIILKILVVVLVLTILFLAYSSARSWYSKLHLSSSHASAWSSMLRVPHSSTWWRISVTNLCFTCALQMRTFSTIFSIFSQLSRFFKLFFLFRCPVIYGLRSFSISWVWWISNVRALPLSWSIT